jgi:hypothetical protein
VERNRGRTKASLPLDADSAGRVTRRFGSARFLSLRLHAEPPPTYAPINIYASQAEDAARSTGVLRGKSRYHPGWRSDHADLAIAGRSRAPAAITIRADIDIGLGRELPKIGSISAIHSKTRRWRPKLHNQRVHILANVLVAQTSGNFLFRRGAAAQCYRQCGDTQPTHLFAPKDSTLSNRNQKVRARGIAWAVDQRPLQEPSWRAPTFVRFPGAQV